MRAWILSYPQLPALYAAEIAVTTIITLMLRRFIRLVPDRQVTPQLDVYEVGYLAGGGYRAAEVIIAGLTAADALRMECSGRLRQADQTALRGSPAVVMHGIDAAKLPDRVMVGAFKEHLQREPGMQAISRKLRDSALTVSLPRQTAVGLVALVFELALAVSGIWGLLGGKQDGQPAAGPHVLLLYILVGVASIFGLVLWGSLTEPLPTQLGSAYLKHLQERLRTGFAAPFDHSLLKVALGGLDVS